jgi:hypothetical protein
MLVRFYMSPPAKPGVGMAFNDGVGIDTGLIPPSVCSRLLCLSIVPIKYVACSSTLGKFMLRGLFKKKVELLSGVPAVRRMKAYSANSGFVYQYFVEGHRECRTAADQGTEFVFTISCDRKNWRQTSVFVNSAAILAWEEAHARELSATERYAIAKMALFQAFDERLDPARMQDDVRVRVADIDGIVETLGL